MLKRDPEVLSDIVELVTSPRELRPGFPYDRRRIEPSHIQAWLTMQTTRGYVGLAYRPRRLALHPVPFTSSDGQRVVAIAIADVR